MLHGCPPSPDVWGRLNVVTPFHHLSGDSHINSSLREGPLRHLCAMSAVEDCCTAGFQSPLCPLWVTTGHSAMSAHVRFAPRKRRSTETNRIRKKEGSEIIPRRRWAILYLINT